MPAQWDATPYLDCENEQVLVGNLSLSPQAPRSTKSLHTATLGCLFNRCRLRRVSHPFKLQPKLSVSVESSNEYLDKSLLIASNAHWEVVEVVQKLDVAQLLTR